jgi:hypothetical protein
LLNCGSCGELIHADADACPVCLQPTARTRQHQPVERRQRPATEIVGLAFGLWSRHQGQLARIAAVFVVPFVALDLLVLWVMADEFLFVLGEPVARFSTEAELDRFETYALLINLGGIFASSVGMAAAVVAVSDRYQGLAMNWRTAVRRALSRLWPLIGMTVLFYLGLAAGLLLLVVPGVYLLVAWFVSHAAFMIEGEGPTRALGRSLDLVRGRWWPTLGTVLLCLLLFVAIILAVFVSVSFVAAFVDDFETATPAVVIPRVLGGLVEIFIAPLWGALQAVMFYDLKTRAAGLEPLPPPPPPS